MLRQLGMRLLAERSRGAASPYHPYINLLPAQFTPPPPIFWPQEAVEGLQYPPLTAQLNKRCRWLVDFSAGALATPAAAAPFAGQQVGSAELGWAMMAVSSRAFKVGGSAGHALLPLIDMANHSQSPNCKVLPAGSNRRGKVLLTQTAVSAGDELCVSYGELQNDEFLLSYGFIDEPNPFDRVAVAFGVEMVAVAQSVVGLGPGPDTEPGAAVQPFQAEALAGLGLVGPGANTEVLLGGPELVDRRLLGGLRVLCAGAPAELQGRTPAELQECALSPTNEARAWRTAAGLTALVQAQFPTSSPADEQLLAGGELEPSLEAAVRFRLSKKRSIAEAMVGLREKLSATATAQV